MNQEEGPTFITILERAFCIMDCLLKSSQPMGISQLSKMTKIPKANTFRIIKTLTALDAVTPIGEGYILGKKLIEYGNGAKKHNRMIQVIQPYLKKLADLTGETANLGIPYQEDILILHTEYTDQMTLVTCLPPITAMYCSSIGKLFLAQKEIKELENYFQTKVKVARTISTLTSLDAFLKERGEILEKRIAYDREEYDYGLSCIAAPIYGENEQLIAGISISGPTTRFAVKGVSVLEEELSSIAREISRTILDWEITLPSL